MAGTAKKTVRFTQVVERAGEPHVHTLWLAPEKDPELKRALAGNRVMTIDPGGGGKSDVGHVGFDPKRSPLGQLLIFPKSLRSFADARIVGIKFDLVEQPKLAPAARLGPTAKRSSTRRAPKARAKARATANVIPFAAEPSEPATAKPEVKQPRAAPVPAPKSPRGGRPTAHDSALVREVRAALRELEEGKAVAAHQRLQAALEP